MDSNLALLSILEKIKIYEVLVIATAIFLIYRVGLSKFIPSIFDYTFYVALGSFFSTLYATGLFYSDLIKYIDYIWILVCTLMFYVGAVISCNLISEDEFKASFQKKSIEKYAFLYFFALFLFIQIIVFAFSGVPLLMESRLSQFSSIGGGFGAFGRLLEVFRMLAIYFLFSYFFNKKKNFLFWMPFFVIVLSLVMSGSKSALLIIIWLAYITEILPSFKNVRIGFRLIVVGLLLSYLIFVDIVQSGGEFSLNSMIIRFLSRLVFYGDVYSYAYVNDVISVVRKQDFFAFFYPFLEPMRIVPVNSQVIPGFAFMDYVYNGWDMQTGPNPRMPVYIDFFYNRNFLLISMLMGIVFGLSSAILRKKNLGFFSTSMLVPFLFYSGASETDPIQFMAGLFNLVIALPFILFFMLVKSGGSKLRKSEVQHPLM